MGRLITFPHGIVWFGVFLAFLQLTTHIYLGVLPDRPESFRGPDLQFKSWTRGVDDRKRFLGFLYRSVFHVLAALRNLATAWGMTGSVGRRSKASVLPQYFAQIVDGRRDSWAFWRSNDQSVITATS